jgi:hypothetical protein
VNGWTIQSGDLLCTQDGGAGHFQGEFWRLIGKLIPGEVDHIVIFVGPHGRCVEAGAKGRVIEFEIMGHTWDAQAMIPQRGPFLDRLQGVAYPLAGMPDCQAASIREKVAAYCLKQATLRKPYNINFLNSRTEKAFYCSQLAYKAYLKQGIDLNTGRGIPQLPGTESIVFPQEIWSSCAHQP